MKSFKRLIKEIDSVSKSYRRIGKPIELPPFFKPVEIKVKPIKNRLIKFKPVKGPAIDDGAPDRIREADLEKLHKLISAGHKDKVKFRDSLYDKYGISKLTHRIAVSDGTIERI